MWIKQLGSRGDIERLHPRTVIIFLTLIATFILGPIGILLVGPDMTVPLTILLVTGLALNLAILWLERRSVNPILTEWIANLGNLALLGVGIHLSGGLTSPYLPLYTIYIMVGGIRYGRGGARRGAVLSSISLLLLLLTEGALDTSALIRLVVNLGLALLTGVMSGWLGQRRIDEMKAAERRAEELAVLNEIGRTINARLDIEPLLEEIRHQTGRLMDVSNLYVALLNEETGQLTFPLFYRHNQRENVPPQNGDEGLSGHVIQSKSPLLLTNMPAQVQAQGLDYVGDACLSWLGVPMTAGDQVTGILAVQSYHHTRAFDARDVQVLQAIASQAVTALDNARLYQQIQERAKTFQVLAQISRRLTRPAPTEETLTQLPKLIEPVIPFESYALYLYQNQPFERIRIVDILDLSIEEREEREQVEQTALERHPGWVVRHRQSLRVTDTTTDQRVRYLHARPPRSILYAPLRYEDRCLGAIGLGRFTRPPFSEADEKLLQAVADQAAVAVENARLYQELGKQAEQLRQAYEELQAVDHRRSEFVKDISHDLRAPLTFISSYAQLMLQDDMGPLTEQQRKSLQVMLEKTDLVTRLAEEIIELEHPPIDLDTLTPTSLPQLIRAALRGAKATAQTAHITFQTQIPDHMPPVLADPRRMMQILDNLISNAIKYSPDDSEVTIQVEEQDAYIQVAVIDEGIGIPEHLQPHIFDRRSRPQPDNPGRFSSMGLGLSIVKELVEAHGGKVWFHSQAGEGSEFYFAVPKATSKPQAQAQA